MVDVNYRIQVSGVVTDEHIEKLIGPQDFADQAIDGLRQWTYKPATLDGKPVEQANARIRFMFRINAASPAARESVVQKYNSLRRLANSPMRSLWARRHWRSRT
jgi:hypothetical protein